MLKLAGKPMRVHYISFLLLYMFELFHKRFFFYFFLKNTTGI